MIETFNKAGMRYLAVFHEKMIEFSNCTTSQICIEIEKNPKLSDFNCFYAILYHFLTDFVD